MEWNVEWNVEWNMEWNMEWRMEWNVPVEIATKYVQFGTFILDDRNGSRIKTMARKHHSPGGCPNFLEEIHILQ